MTTLAAIALAAACGSKDKEGGEAAGSEKPGAAAKPAPSAPAPKPTASGTLFHDPGDLQNIDLLLSVGSGHLAYEAEGEVMEGQDRIMVLALDAPAAARQVGPQSSYGDPLVDGDHVYYVDRGRERMGLWRAPLAGGEPERLTDGVTGDVVAGDDAIYLVTRDQVIWKVPRAGGAAEELGKIAEHDKDALRERMKTRDSAEAVTEAVLGSGAMKGSFSVYAGGKLYRIASHAAETKGKDGKPARTTIGWIDAVPVTGGTPEIIAAGFEKPGRDLQVEGDHLYFLANSGMTGGDLHRVPLGGGAVEALPNPLREREPEALRGMVKINSFLVSGDTVYANAFGNLWRLNRWKLDGTGLAQLTDGETYTRGIALDDRYLYWTTQNERDIHRMPR